VCAIPPVPYGDWTANSGYEAGRRLAVDDKVTAVIVANDQMALGLLRALHERGRAVSDDVSVVGFDDMEEATHFWLPLTTVRQTFAEVGRKSVHALIAEVKAGEHHNSPVAVPAEPVIHRSTATPRRG
jgi:DNA-binding LacI/PurR family transcriptional regulator